MMKCSIECCCVYVVAIQKGRCLDQFSGDVPFGIPASQIIVPGALSVLATASRCRFTEQPCALPFPESQTIRHFDSVHLKIGTTNEYRNEYQTAFDRIVRKVANDN
jgi:hypothetical protein